MKRRLAHSILVVIITLLSVPVGLCQWVYTRPPVRDVVDCLLSNGTNLYSGGVGGVFLTIDDGNSWQIIDTGLTNPEVKSLAVNGINLYAGCWKSNSPSGFFLSTNNGANWTVLDSGIPRGTLVYSLAVSGSNIFAGTYFGISLSTNNGASWVSVDSGLAYDSPVTAMIIDGNKIYAGTADGVYFSTDNGNGWTPTINGLSYFSVVSFLLCNDYLYAGTSHGVWRFRKDLSYWQQLDTDLVNRFIWSLAASDTNIFAGTDSGVYLSTNNGSSWIYEGLKKSRVSALAVHDGYLFAGDGYLNSSYGGGVWRRPLSEMISTSGVSPSPATEQIINAYPNPFSTSTTIRLKSLYDGEAKITIVNLLGIEVTTIFSGELCTGEHSYLWNAEGMEQGMYLFIIRMKDRVEKLPVLLMK